MCIQIVRFLNDGKKAWQLDRLQGESFFFPEHHNSSEKGNTATDVSYQLKAVIVHEGTKISSGHYICYFKRGDQWYCCKRELISRPTDKCLLLEYL